MPPFVGRKRSASPPPSRSEAPAKKVKLTKKTAAPAPKQAPKAVPKPAPKPTPSAAKQGKKVSKYSLSSDSESSLSDVDSDEFEDVPGTTVAHSKQPVGAEDDSDEDDDVEWEDAPAHEAAPDFSNREFKDLKIAVRDEVEQDFGLTARSNGAKKGPSKREKAVRLNTHKMHVQLLMWHNAKRNNWINDKKVQETLLKQLPSQITREIEKWKRASGLMIPLESPKPDPKDKRARYKAKKEAERNQRDWGRPSQRLEEGKPDMSSGDPIISLLKVLAAYWKKRFAVTAPGLRKRGYGSKLGLRQEIESYRNEKHHPAKHGEKIEGLNAFRKVAESCEGSRDVGAQLFVALLRAVGIESRLVASLQPAGYGFTQAEEIVPRKVVVPQSSSSDGSDSDVEPEEAPKSAGKPKKAASVKKETESRSRRSTGGKAAPIELDTEVEDDDDSDDDSVVDVTPSMPKARPAKYDRDLLFPIYWAEAISPITSKVYPVSPLVLENAVATSPEILSTFEPKGAKAAKARQVMAYVIAFSSDSSAKDVTVRYLRKRLWPGKTKGVRLPPEKVPIYDTSGQIKRFEEFDWFKHCMSFYRRSDDKRTAVDDVEDGSDLVIAEPEKKEFEGDTLQSLKASTEFALERHLRREEALRPGAEPVRYFTVGKGDKQQEEPVYKRSDVFSCLTAESWHKDGRAPKEGEIPMKLVPVRAVTLARKREAELHLIRTGEKQMQGLYSREQTDWIIPPPIEDGKIPKNAYGNIDCFVPSMVPKGAVHVPLKGTVRICKKLEIDFAEAVVGFEFGNKMAVPVILGVVIAEENEDAVRDAWRAWSEEQKKKEEGKLEKLVLEMWRKFVLGLRIRDRVQEDYGMDLGPANLSKGVNKDEPIHIDDDDLPGGFMPSQNSNEFGGGFLVEHEDDVPRGDDLVVEKEHIHASQDIKPAADEIAEYPTPVSGEAGGFFPDEDEDSPSKIVKEDDDMVQETSHLVDATSSEEEIVPKPKSRGRPKKVATTTTKSTRRTPARNSKAKIKSMDVDDSDQSGSEESEEIMPVKKRGRGRPKKNQDKDGQQGEPKRGKRLLREESTLVTSPYFEE